MNIRHKYDNKIHDPILRKYHASDYNDNQTALAMGFDPSTIQKHRVALGLASNAKKYHKSQSQEYSHQVAEWPEGVDYR